MRITLQFIRETPLARRYALKDGRQVWIPRSIVKNTTKFPDGRHEIDLPDWKAKDLGL